MKISTKRATQMTRKPPNKTPTKGASVNGLLSAAHVVEDKVKKKYNPVRATKQKPEVWESFKPTLWDLWLEKDESIACIQVYLQLRHNVLVSSKQIDSQFKRWGWGKYKGRKSANTAPCLGFVPDKVHETIQGVGHSGPSKGPGPLSTLRCLHHDNPSKINADIAKSIGLHSRAFSEYARLLKEERLTNSYRSTQVGLLLVSALRAASCPDEKRQALELLGLFHADSSQSPCLELQMCLVKAKIERSVAMTGQIPDCQITSDAAVRTYLGGRKWSVRDHSFKSADLGTWLALVESDDEDSEELTHAQLFIKSQPVAYWANRDDQERDRAAIPRSVRLCVDWAHEQIKRGLSGLPNPVKETDEHGESYLWLNYFHLFTFLLDILRRDPQQEGEDSWWSLSEPETSISPIQLLSTVCRMILEQPTALDISPGADRLPRVFAVKSHVAGAAELLSLRADRYLWKEFLFLLSRPDEMFDVLEGTASKYAEQYWASLSDGSDPRVINSHAVNWNMNNTLPEDFWSEELLPEDYIARPHIPHMSASFNEYRMPFGGDCVDPGLNGLRRPPF